MKWIFDNFPIVAMVGGILLAIPLSFWLRDEDAAMRREDRRIIPLRAQEWADRFGYDGHVECIGDDYPARCAAGRDGGTAIGLECWRDGCAIRCEIGQ